MDMLVLGSVIDITFNQESLTRIDFFAQSRFTRCENTPRPQILRVVTKNSCFKPGCR